MCSPESFSVWHFACTIVQETPHSAFATDDVQPGPTIGAMVARRPEATSSAARSMLISSFCAFALTRRVVCASVIAAPGMPPRAKRTVAQGIPTRAQAASVATTLQKTEQAFESFVDAQPAPLEPLNDSLDNVDGELSPAPSSPLSEVEEKPKAKRKRAKKAPVAPVLDEDGNPVKKKRKTRVKEPIVYVIPEVERKHTTFKGRLGYACLNTVLRGTKPESIFCSRTCRIASIEKDGRQIMQELALKNVRDLKVMIQWNEDNKIKFMRMSSEMFPFASHKKYGYDLSFADKELKEAGDLAKSYGHRLTMHPGQFTQLGSPKEAVVEASVRELEYQCEIMDRMGLDQDGVMIIHMGGVYGDKPTTLARFKENYINKLPDKIKKRLVLENDEICYNVDDIMPVCNELEIPIIFDYHHDWINPSSRPPAELIPLIAETWAKRGIKMKQHLSEPRPGAVSVMERRAHSDRCQTLPDCLPDDVDLMIEAKDKEQAVFELYRIYGLHDVIHENLRPPNENPSMQTNGRKSSLKKKTKLTGEVDDEGNPVVLEDVEKEGDEGVELIGEEDELTAASLPKKRGKNAKVKAAVEAEDAEASEAAAPAPAPLPKKRGRSARAKAGVVPSDAEEVKAKEE